MNKSSLRYVCVLGFAVQMASTAQASMETIGPNGINSAGLNLTGDGIGIGQVESGRPGKPSFDDPANVHTSTAPTAVYVRDVAAGVDANITSHAVQVAGTMISHHTTATGVATGASLHSSAFDPIGPNFQSEVAVTAQHVATRNGGDIRAINMSMGTPLEDGYILDGNSLLTLFVDWSAAQHDVLYVVAGSQSLGGIPVPKDNFNGITVAESKKVGSSYRQVSEFNTFDEDAFGARTSIDLVAPGLDVEVTIPGDMTSTEDGTSFAAPHVTGTVALLQEHAENQIAASAPRWGANARRHEVMKAVLMNSADKIEDNGTVCPVGCLLGMERTVLDQGDDNWLDSNAYTNDSIPLDIQMGAGHLNASRALTQFSTGEYDSVGSATVPVIGWDYGHTNEAGDINKYVFDAPLTEDNFISVTLVWDRVVSFTLDGGTPGEYDVGDMFEEESLYTSMGLYLMERDAQDIGQYVARSINPNSPLQHLFFQIEEEGEYELWVQQFDPGFGGGDQDYALAWWAAGTAPIAGDYDGSGMIDEQDYVFWRNAFGQSVTPGTGADGNGDGIVDAADYTVWRDSLEGVLGASPAGVSPSLTPVPEPSSLAMLLIGAVIAVVRKRR